MIASAYWTVKRLSVTPVIVIPLFHTHPRGNESCDVGLRRAVSVAILCLGSCRRADTEAAGELRVATFRCDITPPLGQPMISCDALRTVEQPLLAKGIVLEAGGQRYVLCALDWCELCNGSYDAMRSKIAAAAGTEPPTWPCNRPPTHRAAGRHRRPEAAGRGRRPRNCTSIRRSWTTIEQRLAAAVKQSLDRLEPFDQIGTGQAKVDRVASSRRPVDETGKIRPR